ncbi:hypothetical protein ACQ4PT_021756 [Festuca glaucescens]
MAGCIFAPYFDAEHGAAHFSAVHRVFGASNLSKLLLQIPANKRMDTVVTVCYEAQARLRDPVYGCVNHISALQQQVANLQAGIAYLQAYLATLDLPPPPPPPPSFPHVPMTTAFSVSDLPSSSNVPASGNDLSSLFAQPTQSQWALQHQHHQPLLQQPYDQMGEGSGSGSSRTDGGDLQALARELLERSQRRSAGARPQRLSRTQ